MPFYLMTVAEAHHSGPTSRLMPRVPIKDLVERAPDLMVPMPGDPLRLRMPGGQTADVSVYSFGVDMWEVDGRLLTDSDPAAPELTLTIQGDPLPAEVPPGTEVWLAEPRYQG